MERIYPLKSLFAIYSPDKNNPDKNNPDKKIGHN